jgi:aminocarboxymuconate-semialdehyde decarboxylase
MLIDLHAHVIPDELAAAGPEALRIEPGPDQETRLLKAGAQTRFTAAADYFSPERRLQALDRNQVDVEVVSPLPPLLDYTRPGDEGRDTARGINEFIIRLCQHEPSRMLGLGTVPMQAPDLAAKELSEIKAMGLAGIEIGSNVAGASLGDERFLDFFLEAERLAVPIFIHAVNPTVGGRLPGSAMASFGFASEIALTAASLVMGGVAERCPELRVAFSHGAGGFPLMLTRGQWFWGRTWNEEPPADGESPAGPSPSVLARHFYYDALVFDRRALRYLIDMLGPDRLIVGTDFPAMPREQPAGRTLRSMDLPSAVLDEITWNNCWRFLGREAPNATRKDGR